MTNKPHISPNDPDLLLAQKIGRVLPELSALKTDDDALLQSLFQYKQETAASAPAPDSGAIWDSIQAQLDPPASQTRSRAAIFRLSPAIKRYAIAAALLLFAFLGSYLYQSLTTPTLVGESFATMEQVVLPDGTTVTLRPYSKLYEEERSEKRTEYRLEGEAFFEVTRNPDRVFAVRTHRSEVEVLGTVFDLSDWGDRSTVYLKEGSVRYTSLRTRESVVLEPGESSTVSDTAEKPSVRRSDESIYTDWLNNELVFEDEPASAIFRELEQHFNIRIESSDPLSDEFLSGSIELSDLNSVLGDLELVLGGSFISTGNRSYVFKKDG